MEVRQCLKAAVSRVRLRKTLFAILFLVSFQIFGGEVQRNAMLPDAFFSPTKGAVKTYVVGTARYIGVSDYDQEKCPPQNVCLHLASWQIYEITGYILPERNEQVTIRVVHRYGSPLFAGAPWFATLEELAGEKLKAALGADYVLVGVEFGSNVFCPRPSNKKYFKTWQSDFSHQRNKCFSL